MPRLHPAELLDIFFPSLCAACDSALFRGEEALCLGCRLELPYTNMHDMESNVLESRLAGRFPFKAATSLLYFVKQGHVQRMMHRLKYGGQRQVGRLLGAQLADQLLDSTRFAEIDLVVPVPLHPRKLRQRGYNQSAVIAEGMAERGMDIDANILQRTHYNGTQTAKGMAERWKNVSEIFKLRETTALTGRKVLLLDDVVTTGSTLEACAHELLRIEGLELYVATAACAEF